MEQNNVLDLQHRENGLQIIRPQPVEIKPKPFIVANTIELPVEEITNNHLIPVFIRDNEPLISHSEFIEATSNVVADCYQRERILKPQVRLSHPVKGRIPEAKDKPASELLESEKTIYYERMMFIVEVPTISDDINGNNLSLTIGGVKCYSMDNLYSRSVSDQHFKIFIGFKNAVCANLCVWSDGIVTDLKVCSVGQLQGAIRSMVEMYNATYQLHHLRELTNYSITESEFAHLIGRCRMYHFLPGDIKQNITPLLLGDQQLGAVVKDYYKDESFCRMDDGTINLWRLYNLFTNATKNSYIDTFLERNANAYSFVEAIRFALTDRQYNWYLN